MSVTVEVTGKGGRPPHVDKILAAFGEGGRRRIFQAIVVGATLVHGEARKSIVDRAGKTGRIYTSKSKSPSTHQASAPGEPPASWTGNLVRGVKIYTDEGKTTAWVAASAISNGYDYAPALEFGTLKMAKRPFLRPAFLKFKPLINKSIKAAIKAAKKG